MSVCSWCKQNNVSEPSYYYYLKRLRQQEIETLLVPIEEKNTFFKKLEVTSPFPNTQATVIIRLPQAILDDLMPCQRL